MTYLALDLEPVPDDRWSPPADKPGAFPPTWAHRIVCVGLLRLDGRYRPQQLTVAASADERDLLDRLSRYVETCRTPTIVTFNGRTFDMPVIAMRALGHGVSIPWYYNDRDMRYRFSERGHLDLCDALCDYGAGIKPTLDAACRLIGLPGKGDVDGSDVARLFDTGELRAIETYCTSDVVQSAHLLVRFRFIQGLLTQDEHDAARDAISKFGASAIPSSPIRTASADADLRLACAVPDTGDLFGKLAEVFQVVASNLDDGRPLPSHALMLARGIFDVLGSLPDCGWPEPQCKGPNAIWWEAIGSALTVDEARGIAVALLRAADEADEKGKAG